MVVVSPAGASGVQRSLSREEALISGVDRSGPESGGEGSAHLGGKGRRFKSSQPPKETAGQSRSERVGSSAFRA